MLSLGFASRMSISDTHLRPTFLDVIHYLSSDPNPNHPSSPPDPNPYPDSNLNPILTLKPSFTPEKSPLKLWRPAKVAPTLQKMCSQNTQFGTQYVSNTKHTHPAHQHSVVTLQYSRLQSTQNCLRGPPHPFCPIPPCQLHVHIISASCDQCIVYACVREKAILHGLTRSLSLSHTHPHCCHRPIAAVNQSLWQLCLRRWHNGGTGVTSCPA